MEKQHFYIKIDLRLLRAIVFKEKVVIPDLLSYAIFSTKTSSTAKKKINYTFTGSILCLRPAKERRRYNVTPSLIWWAQTQNQPCFNISKTVHYLLRLFVNHK